jgi:uncharacterized membrane protein
MFTLLFVLPFFLWFGGMYLSFGVMGLYYAFVISFVFLLVTLIILTVRKRKGYSAFPANDNYRPPS